MALGFLTKVFDANRRQLNTYDALIRQIDAFEPDIANWSIEKFTEQTHEFKERLKNDSDGSFEQDQDVLQEILPEAYAMVREIAKRTIGERTFREQLMVGIALHQGTLAEQKTGEGKTHAAAHPLYLNALTGKGAHLVTVNDYLSRRDAEWMGGIFHLLGLSVGVINSQGESFIYEPPVEITNVQLPISKEYRDKIGKGEFLRPVSRREAYQADITYGTNNEFGFDYLRDNMVQSVEQVVQTNPRGDFGSHHFTIVDEADSILIDEARTPLIISAPAEESNELYVRFAQLIPRLNVEDYVIDEKSRSVHLTDLGVKKIESWLGVDNLFEDFQFAHHLDQALKAQYIYLRDRDYVVKDNEVLIVDEFTGRLMAGRRYSEGLHQALEAKENVPIQKESKTLATITFQNYFRLYEKLAGMSATIMTEAEEFFKIYELDSVAVPTHKPVARLDQSDRVYKNQRAKWKAIVDEIERANQAKQPILVGTTSVEKNELVSGLLRRRGLKHEVLNAKNHAREAEIIAMAGQPGSITVATNMAGRGTDIKLGEGVKELGGLYVIGTERHEARRIDNQLRGRSGRQGDPGESRFFVGLDDDLMRIFGGDKIAGMMTRFNLPEDVPIEAGLVSKSIENAQKKVESHNFDIRKHLVEYDDVINKQREIIYERRRRLLKQSPENQEKLKQQLVTTMKTMAEKIITAAYAMPESDQPVIETMSSFLPLENNEKESIKSLLHDEQEKAINYTHELIEKKYSQREEVLQPDVMRQVERSLMLSTIDYHWMEHIDSLDELRYGVRLRAYGQRDPLVEFKNEAFRMFSNMLEEIDAEVVQRLFKVQLVMPTIQTDILEEARTEHQSVQQFSPDSAQQASSDGKLLNQAASTNQPSTQEPVVKSDEEKIGRNDPCWCGSGKKYKKCHYPELPS